MTSCPVNFEFANSGCLSPNLVISESFFAFQHQTKEINNGSSVHSFTLVTKS